MNRLVGLLGAAALLAGAPAHAANYLFTLTGDHDTATFTLPSSPTPSVVEDGSGDNGYPYFEVDGVTGVYQGDGSFGDPPITTADIQFYTNPPANGGGFEVNDPNNKFGADFGLFSLDGVQLFSGTINNPTFIPGTYHFDTDYFYGSVNETLVISEVTPASAAPEPGTWGLMLGGVAMLGGWLRRRRGASLGAVAA